MGCMYVQIAGGSCCLDEDMYNTPVCSVACWLDVPT